MIENKIILLFFAIFLIVTSTVIICCLIIYKKNLKIVKDNSELYNKVLELNNSYIFHSDILGEYRFHESCATKRKLDNLSFEDLLLYKIDNNFEFFKKLLQHIQENIRNYELYCSQFNKLSSEMNEDKIVGLKIELKTFINIEKGLCKKSKLNPQLTTSVYIKATYTSPKGRNSYYKERRYSYSSLVSIFNEYVKLKKQKEEYSYQVKIERAKMSDSLRYDVLRRDGFKCQICGVTAQEGAKLHVDHIIPVSKGGKTILSNLRTLCDRCNMGKSAKIE